MRLIKPSIKVEIILVILQIMVGFTHITMPRIGFANTISSEADLQCSNAYKEVVLDPWGNIYFYNSYSIQNIGEDSVTVITLSLSSDFEDIFAYDSIGPLTFNIESGDYGKEADVTLRYPLRGNSDADSFNDVATFSISYRVRSQKYLTSIGSWTHYTLNLSLPIALNVTIKSLSVKVTLPEGAIFKTSSYSPNFPTSILTNIIEYAFQDINIKDPPLLTIDYEYLVFWSALRPTFLVGIVSLGTCALMFYRRRSERESKTITDKNFTLIESFAETCDERLLLWSEIGSLEDDFDDKKVRRRDYNRRKKVMQQRLRSLDRTLTNWKSEMIKIKSRYTEIIDRLEKTETEISALIKNIERFRAQYRIGRLTKRTYMQLKESHNKKVEDAKRVMESIVIELKSDV